MDKAQQRDRWKAGDPQMSLRQYLEKIAQKGDQERGVTLLAPFLADCRAFVEQQWPASGSDGTALAEARTLVLAAVALETGTLSRAARRDTGHFPEAAKGWLRRAKLQELAAQELGLTLPDLTGNRDAWLGVRRLVDDFEVAMAPRRVCSLLHDQSQFADRFGAFCGARSLSDASVIAQARSWLLEIPGMTVDLTEHLLDRMPILRLRTYGRPTLANVAANCQAWQEQVEYLEHRPPRPPAQAEAALWALRQKLIQGVTRWAGGQTQSEYSAEDAVDDALLYAKVVQQDPLRRYAYEGDFLCWLFTIAQNQLRAAWQARSRAGRLPDDDSLVASAAYDWSQYPLLLVDWRERFLLAKTFFKGITTECAQVVWESMLTCAAWGDPETDATLAARVQSHTTPGRKVRASVVAGIRRKLRQRLRALQFVLDDVAERSAKDLPDDASVLAAVAGAYGLAQKDVPTIRCLACLARAAQGTGTLLDSIYARLIVDRPGAMVFLEDWESMFQARDTLRMAMAPVRRRRQRGEAWMNQKANQDRLRRLRGQATAARKIFLVASCWCLQVLREQGDEQVVKVLNVSPAGTDYVREILRGLQPA